MKTVIYVNGIGKYPDRRKLSGVHDYAVSHGWNLQSVERLESAATGHSILEEILSVRMDMAKQLLSQMNPLPIDVIANRSGYKSIAAFSKAFHDKNGMPPTAWRRQLSTT